MCVSDAVELEDISCPLGCARHDRTVLRGSDRLHNLPGTYAVVKCMTCGLMRTNPRPTLKTMGFYYPNDYGPYKPCQTGGVRSRSPIRTLASRAGRQVFRFNTEILPRLPPGRLLEFGCASGAFLSMMQARGWDAEGIEISAGPAEAARRLGLRVFTGPLEAAPAPAQPFSLVVGWMVLEHLHEPVSALRKLATWAEPDSWLVLSVPNCSSADFLIFRERCYALQLPTHLYHFTPTSLRKVLKAGGWNLERIYHQRNLGNLVGSVGHTMVEKGWPGIGQRLVEFPGNSRRWPYLLYPFAWMMSLFAQTGRMTVWARRRT